ncbi:unnamed protein product [Moneuplotes crassus]|uniref:Uncharacterized protein n=1 Tax=Euplotes crassus TaxID=5936 RepID=A0AAD2D2K1_EUPCR|nr:unnamed protein product [Moneuplotes crassus]
MIECAQNIQKVKSKVAPIQDAKTVINMSIKQLLREKEFLAQDLSKSFEKIIDHTREKQKKALENLTQEYEQYNNEYIDKINQLESSLSSVKIIKSIDQSLKAYSEIDFIKWFTSKHNPVQKLVQTSKNVDMTVPTFQLTFDKQKVISELVNLFNLPESDKKKPYPNNCSNGIKIGRNYRTSNPPRNLNKCYSVAAFYENKSGMNPQLSTFDRTQNQGSLKASPPKNLVEPQKSISKESKTTDSTFKVHKNSEQRTHREKSNILSFLKKNNKMKKSKLKCAARTKIDLKSLNSNKTSTNTSYLNNSMISQTSPYKKERCETTYDNYVTETKHMDDTLDKNLSYDLKSRSQSNLNGKAQPVSDSPEKVINRAINMNDIKKSNQELIRKSLQNFESSFRDILGDKHPPTQMTERSEDIRKSPDNLKTGAFIGKRFSASCIDYQTKRNQKKMQKTQNLFQYRSQKASRERCDNTENGFKADRGLKEVNSNKRNIQINSTNGYKVKIPLKCDSYMKGVVSIRESMQTSNSFLCQHKKLNTSNRKTWKNNE